MEIQSTACRPNSEKFGGCACVMSIFFVSQLLFYLRITHFVFFKNEIELLSDDTLEYYVTEVVDTKGLWIPISLNYFVSFMFVIAFFKT